MLHKIIATMLTLSLVSSLTFAQEMPGSAAPIAPASSEEVLILGSAPDAPSDFETLSEITITPEVDEAVFTFSTDVAIHAVIEYGLTREYDYSLTTEPQKMHTETIGELTACATYYYRVHVGEESREGTFKTLCPVVKKVVKKSTPVVKKVVSKAIETSPEVVTPEVMNNEEWIMNNEVAEEEIVLNAAPEIMKNEQWRMNNEEEILLNAAPEIMKNEEWRMKNEVKAPQSPVLPGPIAFGNDTLSDKGDTDNTAPVGLLLFALLSGMVLTLFAFKKKKKWYQK